MELIAMSSIVSLMVITLLSMMLFNLKESEVQTKNKKTTFECGYNSVSMKKMTFSTNFFMVSMLFLVFDMEISFLLPSLMSNKNKNMSMMLMSLVFIILLTIILMKEWKQGSLEWNK